MARIWQEGFEHNHYLHNEYLEAGAFGDDQKLNQDDGSYFSYSSGRNSYSQYSLLLQTGANVGFAKIYKYLSSDYTDLYIRVYFKVSGDTDDTFEHISFLNNGTLLAGIRYINGTPNVLHNYQLYITKNSSYQSVHSFSLYDSQWYRIELRFKVNATTGAVELKLDGTSEYSESSIDTGSTAINEVIIGHYSDGGTAFPILEVDDIALNDTTGTVNNSWPGSGTIVALIPDSAGNYSQWDNSEGRVAGESGTTTTNVTITGHGLSTNDWVYNYTRDEVRQITVVDANNFTVSSVTSQTDGDLFILYEFDATHTAISADSGDAEWVQLDSADIDIFDLLVDTTRGTYGIVRWIGGQYYYWTYSGSTNENMYTVVAGDEFKVYKTKHHPITNHYEAVNFNKPNHQYSRIRTGTSGDIDTFGMEGLVADKSLPSLVEVKAIRHIAIAKDLGEGSQIKPVLRISSTDYEGSTKNLVNNKQLLYETLYNVSPATSAQWTQSEVDGLEAGVKKV